ncbi:MAG: PD-(D/E)XK nuclease family protein [Deltaproteobacteria bacterium]|nr:PD-(D/E)XK nuclease family protein [Deltaproteobacteria bacterium]
MPNIRLSPSALNLFLDCPRCFWLDKNKGIKRPRGIFPSLPGGMDLVIKKYFDTYRIKNELPPEIKGKVSGHLFSDMAKLEKWRNWRNSDLCYKDSGAELIGALDDCLMDDSQYIPLDYKTRGSELSEDPRKYYQNQLDCYCLMLEHSGFKTKGLAYLVYYWPEEVCQDGVVKFHVEPIRIDTNIESAKKTVSDAVKLLSFPMPQSNPNCEYCTLVANRKSE